MQDTQRNVNGPHLFHDHYQNFKRYNIPRAQLMIADIPYNIGVNAYGSNPSWYVGGDNANGESELAGKEFFDTDKDFRIPEFLHFCSTLMIKEPKEAGRAPAMIVFCAFEQQFQLIEEAKKYAENADYLILDSFAEGTNDFGAEPVGVGAAGVTHDWNISKKIVEEVHIPVILAGGLDGENVADAIRAVHPYGVDSMTKTTIVEDGKYLYKDMEKLRAFIENAQNA